MQGPLKFAALITTGSVCAVFTLLLGLIWAPLAIFTVICLAIFLLKRTESAFALFLGMYIVLAFARNPLLSFASNWEVWTGGGSILKGLDFLLLVVVSSGALLVQLIKGQLGKDTIIIVSTLMTIAAWALYGWSQSSFQESAHYARLASYFIFAFVAGGAVRQALDNPAISVQRSIIGVGWLGAIFILLEVSVPLALYQFLNIPDYLSTKYGIAISSPEAAIEFNTRRFLNLPNFVDLQVLRPMGLMLHTISSGYLIGAATFICFTTSRPIQGLILGTALLLTGAKGPIIVTCLAIWGAIYSVKQWGFIGFACQVAAATLTLLILGLIANDVHALSLLSSISDLFLKPLGSGLGVGGSVGKLVEVGEWGWTARGDSSLAAIVSMMGLGGIMVLATYSALVMSAVRLARNENAYLSAVWFISLTLGIVFQEEGLSPAACGLFAFYFGIVVSKSQNFGLSRVPKLA